MSFKADIRASAGWSWSDGAIDNGRLGYAKQLLEGNGDNQAEAVWHAEDQVLADGESTTLDLTNLTRSVLEDLHTVTFLKVRALLLVNLSTGAGELIVGGAGADEWSAPFTADGDQLRVPPDSPLLLANRQLGWDVDDSHKNLLLAASGGDVTYSVAVVGNLTASGSGSSGSGV